MSVSFDYEGCFFFVYRKSAVSKNKASSGMTQGGDS